MTITRRNALKSGIAAFLAAGQSQAQGLRGKKVIVIGAGIAGLGAAKALQGHGAEVLVLEAGSYIGGRIRTDHSMGAPFEYGAAWIHGPSRKNPVKALAVQVNATPFVTDDDSLEVFYPRGRALSDADYERLDGQYAKLLRVLNRRQWGARSIKEAIAEAAPEMLTDPMALWMLSAYVEFELGTSLENVSANNAYQDSAFRGADEIILDGYSAVLAPLVQGLDIRLNTPVSQVSYGETGVAVNGERADYAVCTAPLGVLKAGRIRFEPPLPQPMQAAIDGVGFGTVTKIALKFERAFWDVDTQYFGILNQPAGRWNYWLNYRRFSDENILLGFSFGDYAPIADTMPKAAMTADALEVLRSVWGGAVGAPRAVLTTHWSQDPNFRGAYSYPQAGGSIADYEHFAAPVAGRVFMAGEHTIFKYHSTTHGALLSGERAAKQIAAL